MKIVRLGGGCEWAYNIVHECYGCRTQFSVTPEDHQVPDSRARHGIIGPQEWGHYSDDHDDNMMVATCPECERRVRTPIVPVVTYYARAASERA